MWRRAAIDEAGGWQHDTLTEDTDLSYRAQLKGWKFIYLQDVECPAELPVEMTAFKTQQARWAKGLIQTGKKILPRVLRSDALASHQNRSLVSPDGESQLSPDDRALGALLPAMIIRFYQGWFQMLYIDLPLFMASTFSDFQLLPGVAKRTFPEELAARAALSAISDGARHRPDHHQHQGGHGSADRQADRICAHAEIPRGIEER